MTDAAPPGYRSYRGYAIMQHYANGQPDAWQFAHEHYDGAPIEPGGPPADKRCGAAPTLADAMAEIDLIEDERAERQSCGRYPIFLVAPVKRIDAYGQETTEKQLRKTVPTAEPLRRPRQFRDPGPAIK